MLLAGSLRRGVGRRIALGIAAIAAGARSWPRRAATWRRRPSPWRRSSPRASAGPSTTTSRGRSRYRPVRSPRSRARSPARSTSPRAGGGRAVPPAAADRRGGPARPRRLRASLVLFVRALRAGRGPDRRVLRARPFFGAVLSVALFREALSARLVLAGLAMAFGVVAPSHRAPQARPRPRRVRARARPRPRPPPPARPRRRRLARAALPPPPTRNAASPPPPLPRRPPRASALTRGEGDDRAPSPLRVCERKGVDAICRAANGRSCVRQRLRDPINSQTQLGAGAGRARGRPTGAVPVRAQGGPGVHQRHPGADGPAGAARARRAGARGAPRSARRR